MLDARRHWFSARMSGAAERWLKGSVSVLDGIRPYKRSWLSSDIVAGITLAALAIPEVMGYTKIAGTPVITGLYTILSRSAFALFGSSRHLVVGGDSATAAIMYAGIAASASPVYSRAAPQWVALASLSALLAAGFLLLARLARGSAFSRTSSRNGAGRLPDRRRHPGRDRARWRHARRALAQWSTNGVQRRAAQARVDALGTSARRRGRRRSSRSRCSRF